MHILESILNQIRREVQSMTKRTFQSLSETCDIFNPGSIVSKWFDDFKNAIQSLSQHLAVVSLIFKKSYPLLLKHYRPLSLTNTYTDYRIIAFVFARRLQNILDDIINKNQSGYI